MTKRRRQADHSLLKTVLVGAVCWRRLSVASYWQIQAPLPEPAPIVMVQIDSAETLQPDSAIPQLKVPKPIARSRSSNDDMRVPEPIMTTLQTSNQQPESQNPLDGCKLAHSTTHLPAHLVGYSIPGTGSTTDLADQQQSSMVSHPCQWHSRLFAVIVIHDGGLLLSGKPSKAHSTGNRPGHAQLSVVDSNRPICISCSHLTL